MSTVYVLGAGASAGYHNSYIGETSPVSKNFFPKAVKVMSWHNINGRNFNDENVTYNHLFNFIYRFWGIKQDCIGSSNVEIDMEEVLTLLHIEMEENPHCQALKKACREYMLLMALTFDKILYGSPCPHHQKIANSLQPGDVVISFNYELLMDNALMATKSWYPGDGYGVKCNLLSSEVFTADNSSAVHLLKLHGSLNWLYCTRCRQLFTAVETAGENIRFICNHSSRVLCTHMGCRHPLIPIIIPPTMMKNYDSMPFTQKLWRLARTALANAHHIIIIGYSLPPTDFRTKWLFRKAMHESTVPKKVTLVNHATGEKLQKLIQQYSSLMRTDDVNSYPTIAHYASTLS
ncbi:hypothetical protein JOC37_002309 [Desulfohalotomaculum tongense]|uniref:SIR2 family protein n=1 Tax=Desulforadius tongensis TaxID=1216062 RepID=UPI0019592820|nr:SIR2 family protein [Desulforadius tongensis]MBM7855887.1 hypothetical protein [Desulforadius tongensis]